VTTGFFADLPFFEATVFEATAFPAEFVFGAALVEAGWVFLVVVFDGAALDVVFDCGRASDAASTVSQKSAKLYLMSNKKGRPYRSKPAPLIPSDWFLY
jgi:hypothetical protein